MISTPNRSTGLRLVFGFWFLISTPVFAATVVYDYTVGTAVPDGSIVGWSDTRAVSGLTGVIQAVEVSLNITGGYNGDLFAQLVHDSGYSVLLNRVGRRAGDGTGYADGGLNVVLADDHTSSGDIHTYRRVLFGNDTTSLGGPLSGRWSTDARTTDPALVIDTDSRTASLADFIGLDPNGNWTLFVADMDSGGQSTMQSWGLTLITAAVPESRTATLFFVSLSAVLLRRRRHS
ncbi:MAG: PEP-CTERM sorting domain-containing protein [Prosthecobacter sp.]|jgi:subtilisin-like proprotein convertase family protein|uniref:hypothetical protein n=1 Tax=Prosthecobacter sp. TaxID=1965333 RepID=UPI0019E62699|nr:hypothetical protein [Prosthecobacter sp.]MBE2284094.1 PEP-CTERM sorting domain-containing protein [Prosthecobacter sp.]